MKETVWRYELTTICRCELSDTSTPCRLLSLEPRSKRPLVARYDISGKGSDAIVVVIDLPLLRVAVEGSDNPVSLEKPCQASLPPDQQGRHSLGRHPEVQYVA